MDKMVIAHCALRLVPAFQTLWYPAVGLRLCGVLLRFLIIAEASLYEGFGRRSVACGITPSALAKGAAKAASFSNQNPFYNC